MVGQLKKNSPGCGCCDELTGCASAAYYCGAPVYATVTVAGVAAGDCEDCSDVNFTTPIVLDSFTATDTTPPICVWHDETSATGPSLCTDPGATTYHTFGSFVYFDLTAEEYRVTLAWALQKTSPTGPFVLLALGSGFEATIDLTADPFTCTTTVAVNAVEPVGTGTYDDLCDLTDAEATYTLYWENGPAPPSSAGFTATWSPRACSHGGILIGHRPCLGCPSDHRRIDVFVCDVYGKAATRRVAHPDGRRPDRSVACCVGCQKFQPGP